MPAFHKLTLNFNAGELSPFLTSRTDIQKYESGCQTLSNFIILPYGGVIRRPGTQWLGKAKFPDKKARLIGFNFSVTTNFILEFGEKYVRFWTNGVQVTWPTELDKEPAAWVTATNYVEAAYVTQGTKYYRCLIAHKSGVFVDDLNAGKWLDVSVSAPPLWVTAHAYVLNERVSHSGHYYYCLIAHTSGTFADDLAAGKWQEVVIINILPVWISGHAYVVGDRVMESLKDYQCLIAHTSGTFATDLAAGKWKQIFRLNSTGPLELSTPYLEADLQQLQYTQINDLMYIVHPAYPPAKLTRNADDNWTYAAVAFTWPPTLEENIANITITPSAATGNITLTASSGIFESTDVGSTWQIGHNMAGASQTYVDVALGATSANSGAIRVRGAWSFITYGTWKGEVRLVRTIYRTNVTETIRTYFASADGQRNISTTGTEDEDCSMYIAFITGGSAGSSTPTARLEFANSKVYGLVQITGYSSPTSVTGGVTWGMSQTAATIYWSKPAFSATQGYPRTVCLHDQRLIYGGTKKKPLSFHGSQIDDYDNFQRGVAADAAFFFNIAANESNPIQWMASQTKLLIGTAGDEWAAGANKEDETMGAGNIQVVQQSHFGSSYLQARLVNEVVLFSQRQGKKIRELTYSFEKDGWVAPDLTILASHISGSGFMETAFCQQPDAILWSITKDGRLIGMTYERDQNVVGWHQHFTDGTFESVATIYGGEDADEVWFSVKRQINGVDVRYIERFDPAFRNTFDKEDKNKYWYLDCAFRSSNASEVTTVSGLSHLEGKTCGILGDGAVQPTRTVVSGNVTIQEPAKIILVGLPYSSIVRPMNLNIPLGDTMQGRTIRIHKMVARFYKSLACKFSSDDGETWDEIYFRDRDDLMDASPRIFTGDKEVSTGAGFDTQQAVSLMQDRPLPLCVLAEILWVNFYGQ